MITIIMMKIVSDQDIIMILVTRIFIVMKIDQDREFQGRRWTFAKLDLVRKIGQELLLEYKSIKGCC